MHQGSEHSRCGDVGSDRAQRSLVTMKVPSDNCTSAETAPGPLKSPGHLHHAKSILENNFGIITPDPKVNADPNVKLTHCRSLMKNSSTSAQSDLTFSRQRLESGSNLEKNERGNFNCSDSGELSSKCGNETTPTNAFSLFRKDSNCNLVSSYINQNEFSNKLASIKSEGNNFSLTGEPNINFSRSLGSSDTSKEYSCRKPVKKMKGCQSPRLSCHSPENNLCRGSECESEFSAFESAGDFQKSFRRRNGVLEQPVQRRTASDFSSPKTRCSAHETGSNFSSGVFFKMNGYSIAFTLLLLFILFGLDNRIPGALATERPRYRTTFACEGSTLNMDCEPGHVINLIRANYGRFSITICNEHGNTEWSVNCMSRRSHRVLHDKCSQRQNCSVAASTRGFGDPCPGTLKYLEAQFQCVPVNLPHGRPRPSWLMEAQSTVSSITGDQPLQRPPHARDRANSPTESGGLGSSDDAFAGLPDSDAGDGVLDSELLDPDGLGSSSSTSTTTTLRPPPWLKTNITKNSTTTTTTTTTSTTSTTTTTTPPRPSTPNNSDSSPSSSMAPPLDDESNLPPRGRVEGAPATIPVSFPDSQAPNSESDRTLGEDDLRGRQEIFEDQDMLLEEEMGHSFSQNYPQVPVGQDRASENLPSPGWRARESWCGPSSGRGLMWNWTRAGEKAVQACPGGASGWARRDCYTGGWAPRADLGECRSVWLSTLTSRAQGSDSVLAVVHDLSAVTAVRSLYGGDVTAAARLLTSLAKRMSMSLSHFPDAAQREALLTELLSTTLASASHLIGSQEDAWGDLQPNEHRAAVTTLLLGLEQAAFLLADNLRHQKVVVESYPNILMRLQVLETRNVANPVTFPSLDEVWQVPTPQPGPPSSASPSATPLEPAASSIILNPSSFPREGSPATPGSRARGIPAYDSITLPPEALLENSENRLIKMVFFSYQGLEKLLQPTFSYSLDPALKTPNRTRLLNSRVVAASLGSGRHIELTEPVIITFALLTTQNVTNASCVFWDYTTSLWSEEGCRVVGSNTTHVSCHCDHLTNFAVLMDFHSTPLSSEHTFALAVITYVGCVISIVCLLLTIVVFHVFKGLQSDRTSIHKNLCACLLVAEIIFLGGINQTGNRIACGVIAGLLHYFFLAAFAWMFMEGLQLYLLLVEVFEAERSRLKWYCLASYGAPAIVVVVSLGIDPLSYGTPQVCWLRTDNNFIFAFIGPVAAILLANAVFLVLSLVVLCRHTSTSASLKNKEHTKLASVRTWLRGAFVLVFLLGLTWTFGLLYLNQQTVVMAYIFTVLNALQGLFIFIFHCIQNDKVKKEMRGACRRHAWLRACLCDYSHGLNTPSSSVVSKPDTRANSLRRHPSLSPSAVLASATHPATSKYSFKSCGRDSGHGGSEQDESSRSGTASKLTSLRLNNNVAPHQPADRLVNSFTQPHSELPSPDALLPDYRLAGDGLRLPQHPRIRNQSPYNHTYTEISEGSKSISSRLPADPVYEEIEREGRLAAELQVSDMSDEDGRRLSSDVSRQSSRSYGDHRPLLPYTLPDHLHGTLQHIPHQHFHHIQHQLHQHQLHQNHIQQIHMQQQHQLQQQQIQQQLQQEQLQQQLQQQHLHQHHHLHPAQMVATAHPVNAYETRPRPEILNLPETVAVSAALSPRNAHSCLENLGGNMASVVQPLSEPNLRNWEAVQHRRDMAQLQQHLGEMTVAVLNGEQVVCKLKSPLTPIQEAAHQNGGGPLTSVESAQPQQPDTMQTQQQYQLSFQENNDEGLQHSHADQSNKEEIPVKHQPHKHPVTSLTYSHC